MKAFVTLLYSLVLSKQSQQHGRTLMDPLTNTNMNNNAVAFSHIQLYVDRVKDLYEYKRLEEQLNEFDAHCRNNNYRMSIAEKKATWKAITGDNEEEQYTPQNRDVVRQLLAGLGFRVTGARCQPQAQTNTKSVLVTSKDPKGLQILVTAVDPDHTNVKDELGFFDAERVRHFLQAHQNRQGIAVLAFAIENVQMVFERYQERHPKLVVDYHKDVNVLEVYAYYKEHETGAKEADTGTIIRFLPSGANLPGLVNVPAQFDGTCQSAYSDHWVSNVFSRTEFLETLKDTLGFTPKVDFNAGVVAAGEAQIESTVTGNDSGLSTLDNVAILQDQSQVYLPINNALSQVGHVHGFLQEIGQGVQHVASRVENLVDFVQRGNDYRKITNEGFSFLRIPRSYYGVLTIDDLMRVYNDKSNEEARNIAEGIISALEVGMVLSKDGAVDLDLSVEDIDIVLDKGCSGVVEAQYLEKRDKVLDVIMQSRYKNLYGLLGRRLSDSTYLGIVRNQILVDIQGQDLLFQIFTSNILQREAGEEAPFFEFIERVCALRNDGDAHPKPIKPGCGGFGIRNFLTLFLSIEVSKAMQDVADAKLAGDKEKEKYAQAMVDIFTDQLNESNPILTEISNAMTEEGKCRNTMLTLLGRKETSQAAQWKQKMEDARKRKEAGNTKLMQCSARYNDMMKAIREARQSRQ